MPTYILSIPCEQILSAIIYTLPRIINKQITNIKNKCAGISALKYCLLIIENFDPKHMSKSKYNIINHREKFIL